VIGLTTAEAATIGHDAEGVDLRCARLAREALLDAIVDFSNAARDDWAGDEALICTCFFVSERTIEREIQAHGLTTVAEVTKACNAGGGCGSCHQLIQEILATNDLPR
jgi:NifU-like protein